MYAPKPMRPLWPPPVKRNKPPKVGRTEDARRQPKIPLTHHEILALAEPFTRRGRHVDLAGSDRLARRILFKPTGYPDTPDVPGGLTETLVLESHGRRHYGLIRTLIDAAGRVATLRSDGPDPEALIEQVDAVDPRRHFPSLGGVRVACSYRIETEPGADGSADGTSRLVFLSASTDLDGIGLELDARVGHGMPAEIRLLPAPQRTIRPPEDLLAVLGWAWRSLRPFDTGWRAHLRIPAAEPARTPDVEAKLARTLEHLVATLGSPPADFHRTWLRQRWFALARRTLGLMTVAGLVVIGPGILMFGAPEGSPLRLLSFVMPALLILVLIARHEAPSMKITPLPRPLPAGAWEPIRRETR
ncbi:hypothetical protein [Thiocapsa bogorovii]|uniref:hypothetical protein n=1 Tax=Thiocapsa bogorovii TaxID=521689 RepID=UPI001E421271|nr:hypothetical protein [Thiocapsa bogorovii]UHD14361.1 hypothetical protein LT988_13710 [Thiocapsa bogorovii]